MSTKIIANHSFFPQVNIVGMKRLGNIETVTIDDIDACLNGTVRATFIMCKAATPHLIETKGNIVNMSSVSGMRAVSKSLCLSQEK